jgi:hypothetical protein
MKALRTSIAIMLLLLFSFPLASSLFAATRNSDEGLPACCRRGAKHHCMGGPAIGLQSTGNVPQFRPQTDRCPFLPYIAVSVRPDWGVVPVRGMIFAGLVSHPAVIAQTQSKWRISRDRSRQKRGPPVLSL